MRKRFAGFIVSGFFLAAWVIPLWTGPVWAQGSSGEFTNLGIISVSRNYTIAEDYSHIIFQIRNNSGRTIHNIYGWVYRYTQGPNGKPVNFVLVNNPHQGGIVLGGKSHRPTEIADWRFRLIQSTPLTEKVEKYTLSVTTKSIFFARGEPPKTNLKKP